MILPIIIFALLVVMLSQVKSIDSVSNNEATIWQNKQVFGQDEFLKEGEGFEVLESKNSLKNLK